MYVTEKEKITAFFNLWHHIHVSNMHSAAKITKYTELKLTQFNATTMQ